MKRKIRLTESDLHRVIKESVNNILAELDWKTCTASALERCKRSGYKSDLAQKDIQHAVKTAKKQQSKNKEEFDQDFKDYFNNKTQYVKGNGWVKESINRVIKESVEKVLRENENNKILPGGFWYKRKNEMKFDDHTVYYVSENKQMISVYDNYTGEWEDEEYDEYFEYDEEYADLDSIYEVCETEIFVTRTQDNKTVRGTCVQDVNEFNRYECAEKYESLCRKLQVVPAETGSMDY